MWRATDGPRLALLGAAEDRVLNAQIVEGLDGVADWAGRFSLAETAAAIAAADLLVGVDSGPGHLARSLGVKVVSIMSGANSTVRWAPDPASALTQPVPCAPCRRTRCPVTGHPCLAGVTPERVFAAAQEALGG
jgi:ADP-heptose:LPS heptosyltransferase